MDPVDPKQAKGAFKDRKDKDIDNDGDIDKTDKYLHTRRNAITKAMSEKKKGIKDKIDVEPKIDDKGDMRGVQEAERRADAKVVKVRNPDGTMSFRKERPEIKVEEVEEMEEELTPDQINIHKQLAAKHRTIAKSSGGDTRVAHQRAVNLHTGAIKNTWYKKGSTDAMAASRKLGVKEDADLTQEDIDFISELNDEEKVDELDKKTLDKYSTRARFSSNPKHREGALKAMDKLKNKSKNEK